MYTCRHSVLWIEVSGTVNGRSGQTCISFPRGVLKLATTLKVCEVTAFLAVLVSEFWAMLLHSLGASGKHVREGRARFKFCQLGVFCLHCRSCSGMVEGTPVPVRPPGSSVQRKVTGQVVGKPITRRFPSFLQRKSFARRSFEPLLPGHVAWLKVANPSEKDLHGPPSYPK